MAFDLMQTATIALMTAVSYASTNVDNLLLAVLLLGANRDQQWAVKLGVVTAAVAVMLVCAAGLVVRYTLDAGLVGYLGLLPIVLAVRHLLSGSGELPEESTGASRLAAPDARSAWLTTTALMVANSGDTIALFLPLLAETKAAVLPLVAGSYVITAVLWAMLAWGLASRPWVARAMDRYGNKLLPWIMIGVGIYILTNTATDSMA